MLLSVVVVGVIVVLVVVLANVLRLALGSALVLVSLFSVVIVGDDMSLSLLMMLSSHC